jgi:ABC-type antimicrobial peptide transport system permease subunit
MARTLWPGEDAVGKRVRVGGADSTSPWLTIVGVVGRVKQDSLDSDPRIAMYFPHAQFTARAMNVVIRSADAAQNLAGVRQAIQSIDPDLPLYRVRTMDERVRISLATRRFAMLLLMAFAVMAMVLAVVGVYSVLAYVVNQRRREFGIRLALGSSPRGVRLLILRQGMLVTVVGGAIGVLGALVLAGFMESLLFGITTRDPLTFVSVPGVLLVASLAASSIPARVAARVDPMTALRVE